MLPLEAVEAGIYDLLLLGPDAANACEDVDNTRCGFVVAGGVDKVVVLPSGGRDHDVTGNDDIGTELVAHRSIVGYESRFREALAESDLYPRSTGSGSQSR